MSTGASAPVCGLSDECDFPVRDPIEWLNHSALEHEGEQSATCDRCGDPTDYAEKYAPSITLADSEYIVCSGCQPELAREVFAE